MPSNGKPFLNTSLNFAEPKNPCDKHSCHKYADCVPSGYHAYECKCRKGYYGNGFTCTSNYGGPPSLVMHAWFRWENLN